ncbi:DUF421 domain-containing protein [Oxalobacteraceae bacterium OM1]|nr:DUF421 domain-containing protein [Oxalobacteraceae bacterium OM1]
MELLDWLAAALGVGEDIRDLNALQLVLRAALVYVFALLLVKAAKKRFMGQNSAFDFVVVVILGSVVSRAINGTAPFGGSLAAAATLIVAHRVVSFVSTRWAPFARFVEGEHYILFDNDRIDWAALRRHEFTKRDLESAVRKQLNCDDLTQVKRIVLEPNGQLSVVKK